MKKILLPFIILFAISAIFFLPLYFPETKAIITAEFRGGDIVNMHYPYKYFEQTQLREGVVPLWSRYTGNGFPIFGQSEIGLFNPINTISLLLFNVFDAMVIQIIFTFFIMLSSSYYLGKVLRLQTLSSIFLATTYSFCAYSIFSIVHFPHLQAIALIPLVFAFAYRLFITRKLRYFFYSVGAFVLQLSAGQFQNAYITLLFLSIFFVFSVLLGKKVRFVKMLKTVFTIAIGILAAFLISSVQLISTFLLLIQSPRTSDYFYISAPLSINLSYISTLLSPFIFGDPKTGKFPFGELVHPWDGTLFVGYIPLLFILLFFFIKRREIIKNELYQVLIGSFIVFFLFAWERSSPIYFLFSLPPFSLFRFNSRYFIINILILSIFAGYGFDLIWKKKRYFVILLLAAHAIYQFSFMYSWHSVTSVNYFLKPPRSLELVKNAKRIFSYDAITYINSLFPRQGFAKDQTIYLDILKNTLSTDFNLFYKIPSFNNSISGISPRRLEVFYFRLYPYLFPKKDKNNRIERNFYDITGIDYVITLQEVKSTELKKLMKYSIRDNLFVYVYKVKNPSGIFSFYTSATVINTLDDLLKNIDEIGLRDTALIESDIPDILTKKLQSKSTLSMHNISFERILDSHVRLKITTNKEGLLVFRETLDLPWRAYIDGKQTPIYKANFLGMGIWLNKGTHTVEFIYTNFYFLFGLGISITSLTLLLGIIILLRKKNKL